MRRTRFETFEDRLVLSANPAGDSLGDLVAPPLEHHVGQVAPTLADAHQMTGVDYVRDNYGLRGTGQTVVVIDSGIAYDHQYLGGGYGEGYKVVGGWDFTENDADFYDDGPAGFHGTHVAGIIGNDHPTYGGVAPDVDLVGLRVFSDTGAGYFSWVEDALSWVYDHLDSFENPITTVNLSLGTDWNSDTVPGWANLEDEFALLEGAGVFISVSAGNSFEDYGQTGLSYPAASSYVVPVASVGDDGGLSDFSQRNARVLAAPGEGIASTVPDYVFGADGIYNDWAYASGTSMAAPYVAGASVLLREAMELFGAAGVTQDQIYDHFRNTADLVYDAATAATYHRINVQAAIDALAPADDYGSTVLDAFSLGVVSGDSTLSGMIATLNDRDFFTFTAGASGSVSFAATGGGYLAADWLLDGGGGEVTGEALSFDVVSGQTYTVSLGTSAGIGGYDIDVEFTQTMVDWGVIEQQQFSAVDTSGGDAWFSFTALRAGLVTVEAQFDAMMGSASFEVYDSDMQLAATVAVSADADRVDVIAGAGETFYLRASGDNAAVDFTLTNLVSWTADEVEVYGTSGDDAFTFVAGTDHLVAVNGVQYTFAGSDVSTVRFHGGAGGDSVSLTGSAADDTARLEFQWAELHSAAYDAFADGVETIVVSGGGGNDTANLLDSAGDDRFNARPTYSVMTGAGFYNLAQDFDSVYAYSTAGGNDVANLYDSAGDDRFNSRPTYSAMVGNGFYNLAQGFDMVYGWSTAGGNDVAHLYDSTGDDHFNGYASHSVMRGDGFYNVAVDFDLTYGWSTAGGTDNGNLYDSSDDDRFDGWAAYSVLAGDGFYNVAVGFEVMHGWSTNGGRDTAHLYDSPGDDRFDGYASYSLMASDGFYNVAVGFDLVYGWSTAGGRDTANMYDTAGDDRFNSYSTYSVMAGTGFYNVAVGFDLTYGWSTAGGVDRAQMYDSAGDDRFNSYATHSVLAGDGFYNVAVGFNQVYAYATAGGNDRANLYDSAGDDSYYRRSEYSYLSGNGFFNLAQGFDRVAATASAGGVDEAVFDDVAEGCFLYGRDDYAVLSGASWEDRSIGFDTLRAICREGETSQADVSAVDYVFEEEGNWE